MKFCAILKKALVDLFAYVSTRDYKRLYFLSLSISGILSDLTFEDLTD